MNQHPPTVASTSATGGEIGLLDLVVVIAENIRLLVIVPILAGVLAIGVASVWPKSYTSETYLKLSDESAATIEPMIKSPAVIDKLLAKQPNEESVESKRRNFLKKVNWRSLGQGSNLVVLSVDDPSPERAQELNRGLIESWIAETLPRPDQEQILKQRLEVNEAQPASTTQLINRLTKETPQLVIPGMQNELASSLASLQSQRNALVLAKDELQRQLLGVSRDVILVPPTLPTEPSFPKRGVFAIVSTGASFLLLFCGVILIGAIRFSSGDPASAMKLKRIADLLRLRRKTV